MTTFLPAHPTGRENAPYSRRDRSKRRGEAYSEYVEPLNDTRTKLGDFFNILIVTALIPRL
ncbi:MAG: hypothetical protein K0S45_1152 [Nitrospira sp.]|jgi:hypothetical protein|nr:hypothetical protein [Nitrospira sp.]